MTTQRYLQISDFYGGMCRDEKTKSRGVALNMEEIDIFSNAGYFQAEQIFSADTMPTSTDVYAYCADRSEQVWGYGKKTDGSNEVRLVKLTSAGDDNPGSFSTVFTSADATDIAYAVSPIEYLRQDNGNKDFLYYCTKASTTVKLKSFDITGGTESETDAGSTSMTLTGLNGSYDRIVIKRIFGELFVTNGQYIAKVDKDGVFTERAFTLPNGWVAVDIIPVSDIAIILARDINRKANIAKGFWWDLTSSLQFDDSFNIPFGGPQWIVNDKENIRIFCAQNGIGKLFQLSGAFPGAVPLEMPNMQLANVDEDTSTQPVSSAKMIGEKDNVLYFAVNKSDKTALYAIGQLDSDKPPALVLSKRFHTSNYASHTAIAAFVFGPNFFGAFSDNGTHSHARCESKNSPTRSSNAVYESIIIDDGDPQVDKVFSDYYVSTKPLAASTSVALSVDTDYSGSYTTLTRADGTAFNTTGGVQGMFKGLFANKKVCQIKVALTSSGTSTPKVTCIGFKAEKQNLPASK